MIKLFDIPIPPSVNQLYAGKSRRYKSTKYKQWIREYDLWSIQKISSLHGARMRLQNIIHDPNIFLSIGLEFNIPEEMLFSKIGTVKKIDAANRIKPMLDALSDSLGIDDSRFFVGKAEFIICSSGPFVDIIIEPIRIRRKVIHAVRKDQEDSR